MDDSGSAIGTALMSTGNPYAVAAGALLTGLASGEKKRKSEADQMAALSLIPSAEDPQQINFLHEIDRKRKSFADGTAFASDLARLGEEGANVRRGIISASGGAGGAAISGMLRQNRVTDNAISDLFNEGRKMEFGYTQMGGDLLNKIAQRRLDIGFAKSQIMLGRAVDAGRTANQNEYGAAVMGGSALGQILNRNNNTGLYFNNYSHAIKTNSRFGNRL